MKSIMLSFYKIFCKLAMVILVCGSIFILNSARGANVSLDFYSQPKLQENIIASESVAKSVEDPSLIRQYRIGSSAAKIAALSVGDQVTFRLFDDKNIKVCIVEETVALTGRSFIGKVLDNSSIASSCVVLQNDDGIVLDVLEWKNNRVFQVVSDRNGVTVREKEPQNKKQSHSAPLRRLNCGGKFIPANVDVRIEGDKITAITNSLQAVVRETNQSRVLNNIESSNTEPCTVDILIAYDTLAAKWANKNGGGLKTFAETCVQKMNAALSNTGLSSLNRFRLVDVYEIGGSAGGSLNHAINYASGEVSGTLYGVSWKGVSERRDQVGADIVCILIDTGSSTGTTGLGFALEKNSYDIAGYGYNATAIRAVANAHTMTHEVGHNMGAGHSDMMANVSNRGPQYDEYSRGYYFYAGGEGYCTIMAYNSDGYGNYYTPIPFFSSPRHYYDKVAVGDELHDNTRTLANNFSIIAQNRSIIETDSDLNSDSTTEPELGPLVWITDRAEALNRAIASERRILLVSGRDMCGNTTYFKNIVCEQEGVKKLLSNFVLWYSDCDQQWFETWSYTTGLNVYTLPLVCVIDPFDSETYISRSTGFMDSSDFLTFLNDLPVWRPVNPEPEPEPEPTPEPEPDPEPEPEPEPEPKPEPVNPELGRGDYSVTGDKLDGTVFEKVASVYDGYLYLKNAVIGTIQAKVSKSKVNKKSGVTTAKTSVIIQINGEKKLTLKDELDLAFGEFTATDTKSNRTLKLKLGLDGITGTFGKYDIDGARNFFDSKDKSEKATAEEILKPYLGAYSMNCDGGILSVTIAKKGKVTIKGSIDGNKVSAKAQALIGAKMICIPVIYSKKSVNLAFTIWLQINGANAEIIGLNNADIGKAGTLKNGAKFVIDGDIGDYIETEKDSRHLLPYGETITVSKSKWLVAGGAKPTKVAYKKGEFNFTPSNEELVNPSGLKLSYKSKDGSFKGSFTVYAIVKGKLKKHKATVEGVLVNGIGHGTITIKKIGAWGVTIK